MQLRALSLSAQELLTVKERMFTTRDGSVVTVTDHVRTQ